MKHLPFTDKIGAGIVARLQKQWKEKGRNAGYSVFGDTIHKEPCYAPTANRLAASNTDHFGLLWQGYSGDSLVQKHTSEAKEYLACLLDPVGPFRAILPYLWHTEVSEIVEDKGFVFKDLAGDPKVNLGLLWTFAQASRLMYETPSRMKAFQHMVTFYPKDKPLQLFVCFTLQPRDPKSSETTLWSRPVWCHGEPLGCGGGTFLAKRFLTGNIINHDVHSTSRSWQCFGKHETLDFDYPVQRKLADEKRLLSDWVSQFRSEAKNV